MFSRTFAENNFMGIQVLDFEIKDIAKKTIRVTISDKFLGTDTELLREKIHEAAEQEAQLIYLDLRSIEEIDLSAINEIIHSHYHLRQLNKKLVLVYTKDGVIEKWLANTKLDLFVSTAMVPSSLEFVQEKSETVNL